MGVIFNKRCRCLCVKQIFFSVFAAIIRKKFRQATLDWEWWRTSEKYDIFSRVLLRLFSGLEILVSHRSLYDKRRYRPLSNCSRVKWSLIIHPAIQVQALCLSLRTHQSYKNWATGDPNNGGRSRKKDEDCAVLKSDGKWNDYPCTTRFKYICKARASKLHINAQGIFYANSSHFIANRMVRNIMSVTLPSCEYIIIWRTPETLSIKWSVHLHRVSAHGTIKGF